MPKQIVIIIEQNRNIKDKLKMRQIVHDGQEVKYIVSVMKCGSMRIKNYR